MIFRDQDKTETRNLDREIQEIQTETRVSSNPAVWFQIFHWFNEFLLALKYVFQLDASGEFMLGDLLLFHGWNPPKISVVKFLVRLLLGGSSFYSVNDLTIFLLLSSAPLAFIIISPHQRKLSWEKIENTLLKLSLTYCSINIITSLAHVISVQIPDRP